MLTPSISNEAPPDVYQRFGGVSAKPLIAIFTVVSSAFPAWATPENDTQTAQTSVAAQWQVCQGMTDDDNARLRCYDNWATQQEKSSTVAAPVLPPQLPAAPKVAPVIITMEAPAAHNCKSHQFSELSRFWELEAGSDCGTFGIRGYQPISLSWISSDSVNEQPGSPTPGHTASTATPFKTSEMRIGLSIRTKIAQGLLTQGDPLIRDSIWFAYSQQSNWQLFSGDLSRPFRTTDHEPELIYIYPTDLALPWGWRLRYSGLSINHQSNGQPLPLSRSWNRTILLAGMEKGQQFHLQGKLWYRTPDGDGLDDNPDIADLIGRAELTGVWNVNANNALSATVRHSLRAQANGSVKLEWLRKLGDSGFAGNNSGLRFHTQLFSGFGDSLIDYNRRRTVLSVGLSLVDW